MRKKSKELTVSSKQLAVNRKLRTVNHKLQTTNYKLLAICLLIFIALSAIVVKYDLYFTSLITSLQTPVLNEIMNLITNTFTLYVGTIVLLIILFFVDRKKVFWDTLAVVAIDLVVVFFLKTIIARPRPQFAIINESFYSFPSDHASRAFAIFHIFSKYWPKYKILFYTAACAIAFSRVYLGVHYFADIWFGAAVGIVVSEFVLRFSIGSRLRRCCLRLVLRRRKRVTP